MRIVDAGVVVEMLAGDLDPDKLGEEELATDARLARAPGPRCRIEFP